MPLTNCQSSISFSIVPAHARPFTNLKDNTRLHLRVAWTNFVCPCLVIHTSASISSKHGETEFVHVLSFVPMCVFQQARTNEFVRATLFCYLEIHLINRQSSISFSVALVHAEPFPRMRSGYKPSSPGGMDKLCLSMSCLSYQCVHSSKHG